MIQTEKWYSSEGFVLDIKSGVFSVPENFYHPAALPLKETKYNVIIIFSKNNNNLAFIVDWKLEGTNAFTAFEGKIDQKGNLLLNWFFTSEDIISKERSDYSGASIFNGESSCAHLFSTLMNSKLNFAEN